LKSNICRKIFSREEKNIIAVEEDQTRGLLAQATKEGKENQKGLNNSLGRDPEIEIENTKKVNQKKHHLSNQRSIKNI
jgi:hypothetical protein